MCRRKGRKGYDFGGRKDGSWELDGRLELVGREDEDLKVWWCLEAWSWR